MLPNIAYKPIGQDIVHKLQVQVDRISWSAFYEKPTPEAEIQLYQIDLALKIDFWAR